MTTVRKWGVQWRDGAWEQDDTIPCPLLDGATLYESASHAVAMAGLRAGTPVVREVLVTQEAGGIEVGERLTAINRKPRECVVRSAGDASTVFAGGTTYLAPDGGFTSDPAEANVFANTLGALRPLLDVAHLNTYTIHAIRRTEPREVRRAGRTLDEILASVPVEVPHDD